jgi:Tfp pilus assembly protein PilO
MRPARLWLAGGALCAVVLLAFGWFFFINPKYQETRDLKDQAGDTTAQAAVLRTRLADLRAQNEHLEEYRAELAANLSALPETDAAAALLRQLQSAGELAGITVSGVSVGTSTEVQAGTAKVQSLPISLTAAGPVAKLNPFLDQLQKIQPRAVLIGSLNVVMATAGRATLTITLQAFYASGN